MPSLMQYVRADYNYKRAVELYGKYYVSGLEEDLDHAYYAMLPLVGITIFREYGQRCSSADFFQDLVQSCAIGLWKELKKRRCKPHPFVVYTYFKTAVIDYAARSFFRSYYWKEDKESYHAHLQICPKPCMPSGFSAMSKVFLEQLKDNLVPLVSKQFRCDTEPEYDACSYMLNCLISGIDISESVVTNAFKLRNFRFFYEHVKILLREYLSECRGSYFRNFRESIVMSSLVEGSSYEQYQ